MLRLNAVSSVCLRRGVFSRPTQSRVSARSLHSLLHSFNKQAPVKLGPAFSWLQSLNKQAPAKLGPAMSWLRHNISSRGFFTVGGIAAAGAFASSSFDHEAILQAQDVTDGGQSAKDLVEWEEEFSPLFVWLRRLWVPVLLVMTVAMGWRYPLSLSINLLFLFWSTKPTPSSIYMWVEQKRLQAAARAHGLGRLKTQLSNATLMTHVEVEDYGVACIARVSSLSQKMLVVGVLGDWWVIYSCSSSISGFNIGSWFPISPADQW